MSDLLTRAEEIKNATEIGENTAERVGGVMVDTVNAITSLQERAVNHEDTLTTHGKQITALQNKGQNMEYDIEQQQGVLNSQGTRLTEVEHRADEHDTQIATKQQELTLSVLDNGNIRIGNLKGQTKDFMPATPSGDPMHYAYEAMGAVWNPKSGFWEYGRTNNEGVWMGLTDLSNADMKKAYAANPSTTDLTPNPFQWAKCRTNPRFLFFGVLHYSTISLVSLVTRNNNLEYVDNRVESIAVNNMNETFKDCPRLKVINILFYASRVSLFSGTFDGCEQLEYVRIKDAKSNISFKDSPYISNDSVLYVINNSDTTVAITITLHADAYVRAMSDASIVEALATHTNVTLASA